MFWAVFLAVVPTVFALILCALVGNAVPAIVVGGVFLVLFVLGFVALMRDDGAGDGMGLLAIFIVIVIPSAINALLLLGGSGIYYLARALG